MSCPGLATPDTLSRMIFVELCGEVLAFLGELTGTLIVTLFQDKTTGVLQGGTGTPLSRSGSLVKPFARG